MTDIIQLLPDSVANQIAAGEVIQRPASVVKELVENAVDSGSTDIKINITDAGKTLIQIIDDGCGMSDTDARMAFERHATSKIKKAEDLFALHTLGFRGEALASVAAIAQVVLKTRKHEDELGVQIAISGSEIISQESISCSNGSNFSIKNLFYNIPARRKFLKSNATEIRHIISEFQRIALTNPEIKFSLLNNNTEIYHLNKGNYLQRISQLFRKNINQSLVKISTETSIVTISGFIGKPEHARKSMGEQFFFVNDRYMKHPYFHKAVMMAYENILPNNEWPSYFIYLDVDPKSVDINIHPTKTEIKFEDEVNIWKIINLSVKESIGKFNISPSLDFESKNNVSIPVTNKDTDIRIPEIKIDPEYNPFGNSDTNIKGSYSRSQKDKDNLENWDKLYQDFENEPRNKEISFPETQNDLNYDNTVEKSNSVLFQLKSKFILTSVKSGMMIIDQRRAHIRILFDRYTEIQKEGKGYSQKQMFPVDIQPGTEDSAILDELMPELNELGFILNKNDNSTYSITGIPADIKDSNPGSLLESLLEDYKETGDKLKLSSRDKVALALSRASAINYGKILENEEMENIFNDLFSCDSPTYTPDGRLIVMILGLEEIEQRFK